MVSVSLVYKTIMISCDTCEQFVIFLLVFFLPALAQAPDYVNFEGKKRQDVLKLFSQSGSQSKYS